MQKVKKYRIYFDTFILLFLTVAPIASIVKALLFGIFIILDYKLLLSAKLNKIIIMLLFIMVSMMVFDIKNIDSRTNYSMAGFAYLLPFFLCLIYKEKYSLIQFIKALEQIIFFIAVISLIGMFFVYFFPSVVTRFPTINYYGRKVSTVLLFNSIRNYSGEFFLSRNCGIAWEPGAFQFVVNLGLQLFFINNVSYKHSYHKIIIYIITILSTYSTTGIVIMVLILIYNALKSFKSLIGISLVLIIVGIPIMENIEYQNSKMNSGNLEDRFSNSVYVIENYSNNIFGIGSTQYDKIYSQDKRIGSWDAYTNFYLRFGLVALIIFVILMVNVIRINVGIFILISLTLLTENMIGPLVIIFFYYSLEIKKKE